MPARNQYKQTYQICRLFIGCLFFFKAVILRLGGRWGGGVARQKNKRVLKKNGIGVGGWRGAVGTSASWMEGGRVAAGSGFRRRAAAIFQKRGTKTTDFLLKNRILDT